MNNGKPLGSKFAETRFARQTNCQKGKIMTKKRSVMCVIVSVLKILSSFNYVFETCCSNAILSENVNKTAGVKNIFGSLKKLTNTHKPLSHREREREKEILLS